MFRSWMQSSIALLMAVLFLSTISLVHAADSYSSPTARTEDVSAEAIIVDGLLLRPGGLVATIVGTAVFVAILPFTIPTKSVDKTAQKLVVDPARYTFVRPLGQIDSDRPMR